VPVHHEEAGSFSAGDCIPGRTADAVERFLYRLGRSTYRYKFTLKGATLFTLWTGHTHRPTKDLDLLGRGSSSAIGEVETTIRAICEIQDEDGIVFDTKTVEGTRIKEDDEYDGVRIKLLAELAGARIPMQIDIEFGDAVYSTRLMRQSFGPPSSSI
jgi:hypothetical protein